MAKIFKKEGAPAAAKAKAHFNIIDATIIVLVLAVIFGIVFRSHIIDMLWAQSKTDDYVVSFSIENIRYSTPSYLNVGDEVYFDDGSGLLGTLVSESENVNALNITPASEHFTDANGNTDYTDEVYVVTEDADGILQNPVVYLRSEKYLEKAEVLFVTVGEDEDIELEDVEERFSTSDQRKGRKQYKLNDFLQSVKKKPGTYLVTLYVGLIGNSEVEEPYEITIKIPGDVSTLEITKNIADKNNAVISEKTKLTVTASGSNLTYQWYQDGVKIPGATGDFYDVEDEGTYYVVVSDGKTSVTSYSNAFLSLIGICLD